MLTHSRQRRFPHRVNKNYFQASNVAAKSAQTIVNMQRYNCKTKNQLIVRIVYSPLWNVRLWALNRVANLWSSKLQDKSWSTVVGMIVFLEFPTKQALRSLSFQNRVETDYENKPSPTFPISSTCSGQSNWVNWSEVDNRHPLKTHKARSYPREPLTQITIPQPKAK